MVDINSLTDDERKEYELYLRLKESPEFEVLPLPARWYKLFDIPPVKAVSVKDFIESRYTLKCAFAPKDLPPIIIDEPQQNGKLVEILKEEPIDVKVVEVPYDPKAYRTEEEILEMAKQLENKDKTDDTFTMEFKSAPNQS